MNEIEWIKSFHRQRDVEVDVAGPVMRDIRRREGERGDDLALPALFAAILGGVAAMIAMQLIVTDPFTGFLDAFNLVLQ
jgi:hypothetical protein